MLLAFHEIKYILQNLPFHNPDDTADRLFHDISYITYRNHVFSCENNIICYRHIVIEFCFGEYIEIPEDMPVFSWIALQCHLPLLQEEQEIILYKK